jgi:16S rRNA (guanine527-N7)-methyltransferase
MAEVSMNILAGGAEKLGVTLDSLQLAQFAMYYSDLIDWNNRINLTAITDIEEVQVKHFLDSLTLVSLIKEKQYEGFRVIDVGSGAGFPGIPLKIALPQINMTLLEATSKKALFIKQLVEKLKLQSVEVLNERAEEAAQKPEYREKFDIVVSRAVAQLAILTELTLPFCAVGGYLVAQKKGDIRLELEQSVKAIEMLGGRLSIVEKIRLAGLEDERYLIFIEKIGSTPQKYPRRPGMPEKRPLL